MFSKSCHYGLQAMIYIAYYSDEERNVELSRIAEGLDVPKHFLSKILQLLVKHKLLVSMKGPTGGFRLNGAADSISMIEVIEAIDGLDVFTQCGIGFKMCDDDHPCPIHHDYKKVRNRIKLLFNNKTLKDLVQEIEDGESIVSLGSAALKQ